MEKNTNRLMEMYNSTFQPALSEGVYKVKMLSHEYVQNTTADYIKFTYEVVEGDQVGRKLTDNRFDKGFGVMVSHLRQQLHREDEAVKPIELFNELIENETVITIWITKVVANGRPRTNFNFLEPIAESEASEVPNTEVVEDVIG